MKAKAVRIATHVAWPLLALAIMLFWPLPSDIEGRLLPVSSDTEIVRAEETDTGLVRVWGTAKKHRNCAFLRIDWYLGTRYGGSKVPVIFEEGTKDRDEGSFEWGPWVIAVTPSQLQGTEAYAVHRCHRFFTTTTRFY